MPIEVTAPDGSSVSFPDGTDAATIHGVMTQRFSTQQPPQWNRSRKPFSLMDTREVAEPPSRGMFRDDPNQSTQSIPEMMRNVSQRARNTAFGEGPGSVEGVPGLAVGAVGGLAGIGADAVGAGASRAFAALPEHIQTTIISLATMGGAAGAKELGLPEWFVHWAENKGLIRGFGKHNP